MYKTLKMYGDVGIAEQMATFLGLAASAFMLHSTQHSHFQLLLMKTRRSHDADARC